MLLKNKVKRLEEQLTKSEKEIEELQLIVYNITKNSTPPKFKFKISDRVNAPYVFSINGVKIVHRFFCRETFTNMYTLALSNESKDYTEDDIRLF